MIPLSWTLLLAGGLPVLYLLVLTIACWFPRRCESGVAEDTRILIVIPAHDEALNIAETVRDCLAQAYPPGLFGVLVVADNCSDDTAQRACQAGAMVLERQLDPGKGQALNEAFARMGEDRWHAYLVIDADSTLHPDALAEVSRALKAGAAAVQLRGAVLNPRESIRTRAMELSMASFNGVRPAAKVRLGLSANIANGICLTQDLLRRVPYQAHSIVEDLEYHILMLRRGYQVDFADRVWVKSVMPATARAARIQRVRWEHGRWAMIKAYVGPLLGDLVARRPGALDGLLEVLMPPLSLIAILLLGGMALGSPAQAQLGAGLFGLLAIHYLVASARYGSVLGFVQVAFFAPWFIVWKTYVVLLSLLRRERLKWSRTDRR